MSSENWKICRIEDIAIDVAMGPFGSDLKVDNFIEKGVPVIKGQNLNQNGFEDENFSFVSEEKAQSLKRCLAYPDDLVFTHRGTIGQVGIIPKNRYPYYLVSQSQMLLKVNLDLVDPYFLLYFFKSPSGQFELLKNSSQVGVPAISSPTKSLKGVQITLPPLPTQRRIAAILTALDDKIELNRRMNATLEGIAQALWQEWFGKYARGEEELPEGWKETGLDKIAVFLNGLALQKFPPEADDVFLPVIKIREMKQGITSASDKASTNIPSQYIVQDGDVLFSWSGSLEVDFWTNGKGALNQHLFKVSSETFPKWYYFFWIKYHLNEFKQIAESKATTMGHIQRQHLSDAEVLIPSKEKLAEMDKIISPIIANIIVLRLQSRTLTALRDTLLPRLMRGEIIK